MPPNQIPGPRWKVDVHLRTMPQDRFENVPELVHAILRAGGSRRIACAQVSEEGMVRQIVTAHILLGSPLLSLFIHVASFNFPSHSCLTCFTIIQNGDVTL
jgi:hypothetical protein